MKNHNTAPQTQRKQDVTAPASGRLFLLLFYVVFCSSSLIATVPVTSMSVFALMICICILAAIYTYRVRGKKARNKLVIAHTTYIIRTFWRICLLLIITSFVGLLYMLVMVEYGPLEECIVTIFGTVNKGNFSRTYEILGVCGDLIIEENRRNLHFVGFIAFSPVFLYVLWRCVRGSILLAYNKAYTVVE